MKKLAILLVCFVFAGVQTLLAQNIQISGKVTSAEDGTALPGVSVSVKGTTLGTITDVDGMYKISVPQSATALVFSFVGMKTTEVPIEGRTTIDVVMEPALLSVDEVVVTALGISRTKKSLGYTVQEVKGDEVVRASNPNLQTAIQGKIAGVEVRQSSGMPGSPSTIFIRGARSFSGNNAPLYVVDGMPIASDADYGQNVTGSYYSNRAIDIDPNDIESINVLKGQAAAALYGLRASNGVIVITTKSGKNMAKGKSQVDFSSSYTIDRVSRLPEVQQKWAQGYYDLGGASQWTFYPAFSYSWGPAIEDLADDPTYGGNNYSGHTGEFFDPYKGQWVTPKAYNNPKNFYSEDGVTWNNNLTLTQNLTNGSFVVGFGATNQNGIIKNTGMDRYTGKIGANMNFGEKWRAGFSANYSDIHLAKLPSGNDSWLFTVYGAPPSFDLMGTPYHMDGFYGKYRQISYRRGTVGENARWAVENNHFLETTRRFFGNSYVEFLPTSWMTVKYQLGVDTYATDNEDLYQMGSTATGQVLPTAGQYPTPNNPVYGYRAPTGGSINNYGVNRSTTNSLLNVTINKQLADQLNFTLILGNEINNNRSRYWSMTGTGFTTPGWNNMDNTTTKTASESKYWDRTVGFYGNLAIDYMSMIFLNATGRNDIVSTMPRGNRSFFYPSVSLGFVFTELEPLKDNPVLSLGKIRASYAEVGQAGYYRDKVYVLGGAGSGFLSDGIQYPLGGISGYKPSVTLYDPNLKPQNTRSWEVGFELNFFKGRIGLDYTYSDQLAKDQIFAVPLAGSTGYAEVYMNAGKMSAKGHEVVLNLIPVKMKSFQWNIAANFTKIVNKCIELAPGVENIALGGYVTPNIRASAGDTYPAIYGNQFKKDDKGRVLVDEDPDSYYYGMPLMGDFGKVGEVSPKFILGVTNTFTIANMLTLSAQIDWKNGGQMYSGSNRLIDLYGTSKRTEDRTNPYIWPGYKADGTKNDIQRGGADDIWAYPDLYADVLSEIDEAQIYETSFVKLREVSVGLMLPKKLIAPARIQNASVNFIARNILLWTTFPNFDPETSQGMGNMQGGMDYMSLPQTTSYGIGLNITF